MNYSTIILEKRGNVTILYLNRPAALNAINNDMRQELIRALDEVEADVETRALVITGKGRAFCAGGDVKGMGKRERPIDPKFIVSKLVCLEKPVITAINGVAVGGGCNLALSGDVILASEKAKFSQTFVNIGLVPDWGGMYLLPRLVGMVKAKELMFTGAMIESKEALAIGLVNRVIPEEHFEQSVEDFATKLAQGPPRAIALIKKVLNTGRNLDVNLVMDLERLAQGICRETEDHREGLHALREKRTPKFLGK
ncbi:MAG: enoyl-CoA hydratase/isomerase family protein [bacterium]